MGISRRPAHILTPALLFFSCLGLYYYHSSLPFTSAPKPPSSSWSDDSSQKVQPQCAHNDLLAFDSGTPKPPGSTYSRTFVAGRLKKDDVSWVKEQFPDLPTAIYVVDDPSAPLHIPVNKGREAMVYLTYIIDHYDRLADTTLFFHSHRYAWHNNILLGTDNAETIRRLSDDRVARVGYFNVRCHLDPGCPDWLHLDRPEVDWDPHRKWEEKFFTKKVWQELFPFERIPPVLSQPCCAQFAVSRDRIRLNPRSQYIHIRDWLIQTPLEDEHSGRVLEYSWQYLFTRNAELCPRMDTCYCDGFGICFGGAVKLKAWLDKLRLREIAEDEMRKWNEAGDNAAKVDGYKGDGKDGAYWRKEHERLRHELDEEKAEAYKRGDNLENRLIEANSASWREQ